MIVRSSGSWQNHPTYGPQWNSTGYVEEDPSDTETLITYLHGIVFQDIKGLGLKAAKDVVKHFGDQTLSILDESPQKLSELKKFTKARIKQVKKVWRKHRHSRHVILHLSAHGISMGKARKILHALPDNTLETLKKDPFILISKVQGFGFRTVDNIYLSLGGTLSSPDRFAAAIIYYLQHTRDQYGHSFLGKGQILQYLPQLLGLNPSEVQDITEPVIDEMTSMGRLITIDGQYKGHDFVLATHHTTPHTISPSTSPPITLCYLATLYRCEQNIAFHLRELSERAKRRLSSEKMDIWLDEAEKLWGCELTDRQRQGALRGLSEQISILTGGAGVGKTTALRAVLYLAERLDLRVALASPTGRAAQRMKEVTGHSSQTLHRLLEWSVEEKDFTRNAQRPLTQDVIIVDEASMMDLYLTYSLLNALGKSTSLMIIGDPHQLPSVGPGRVLADMIESRVIPHTTLSQIFRQAASSPIIAAASEIKDKTPPTLFNHPMSSVPKLAPHQDHAIFLPASDPTVIQKLIIETITKSLNHLDPLSQIQVLTPVNKGPLGCDELNRQLQILHHRSKLPQDALITPPPQASGSDESKSPPVYFCTGDRVIQTQNDYDLSVYNGDIGVVQHVERSTTGHTILELRVAFPTSKGERQVTFKTEHLAHLKLAYAITIHKSQGSEFPAVIIPLHSSHYIMLGAHLIYTAVTRARHHVILIGQSAALSRSLTKPAAPPRYSRLRQLIGEGPDPAS